MRTVLALNAGSATLKVALFELDPLRRLAGGLVDHWGSDAQHIVIRDAAGQTLLDGTVPDAPDDRAASIAYLLDWIGRRWPNAPIAAVGHRIVHGGGEFTGPTLVDDAVERRLNSLCPLAPLHQPWGLAGLRLARQALPGVPQSASFDTAFHATMSAVARRLPLPREFEMEGLLRYGFHGLSYAFISSRLTEIAPALANGRVVVAHLGSGASLCAMRNGHSVDTTMGFSTLDGLVMATRPGALDPGVLLRLLADGMTADQLSELLYQRSGLLGLSGISGDMRTLLASEAPAAREAIAVYVRRIVREIGAMAAMLGGLDGLVFTGGVGENAEPIRRAVLDAVGWLGLSAANVLVVPTDEEQVIAREAAAVAIDREAPAIR